MLKRIKKFIRIQDVIFGHKGKKVILAIRVKR